MSILEILFSLLGGFAIQTVFDLSEPLSRRVVRAACRLLPPETRAVRQEQMEADLAHVNGAALRIITAIGFVSLVVPEAWTQYRTRRQGSVTMLSYENLRAHGDLFAEMFRARHKALSPRQADGMEFDQYDTPASRWLCVHKGGEVRAGARLVPTTHHCGIYTYFLRDAQRGLFETYPADLLFGGAPIKPEIWELSRWFVAGNISKSAAKRARKTLYSELSKAAAEVGAERITTVQSHDWTSDARRNGLTVTPLGNTFLLDGVELQAVEIVFARPEVPDDQAHP